ncbi:hypothetical protein ACFUJR_27885 [Streptomyces sp. NPDC057271]|uniref:hypothetical protein n=1 Tax=unclassified Streptomyces TaxID=2593676 RepID=UPI003627D377
MKTALPRKPIDHGSLRGYAQHKNRGITLCDECRAEFNRDRAAKRAARKAATPAQQTWNKGRVGEPTVPKPPPTGRDCTVAGCGELLEVPQPAASMVAVVWPGSREPSRWYCAGACAAYGRALAEIRAIGDRRG